MTEYSEILGSQEVSNFLHVAKKYCLFIEERNKYEQKDFLKNGLFLLVDLYQKAIRLDYFCEGAEDVSDLKDITHQQWEKIFTDLSEKFAENNYYRVIFEPYESASEESVMGCLADDFADVYRDLKNAVMKMDVEDQRVRADALNDFVTDFKIHWGKHTVEAIWALHHCVISFN